MFDLTPRMLLAVMITPQFVGFHDMMGGAIYVDQFRSRSRPNYKAIEKALRDAGFGYTD